MSILIKKNQREAVANVEFLNAARDFAESAALTETDGPFGKSVMVSFPEETMLGNLAVKRTRYGCDVKGELNGLTHCLECDLNTDRNGNISIVPTAWTASPRA